MRYMVFNLLVVGALAFLLFDGEPPAAVRSAVDTVADRADRLVETGRRLVGKPQARPDVGQELEERAATALAARTERTRESGKAPAAVSAPAPAAAVAPPPKPAAKPRPTATPKPADPPKAVATPSPPALPEPVAAAPTRPLDPAVARRRAEVLGTISDDATAETAAASEFMSPRVRRSELQKLAEDMELMFVDRVAR